MQLIAARGLRRRRELLIGRDRGSQLGKPDLLLDLRDLNRGLAAAVRVEHQLGQTNTQPRELCLVTVGVLAQLLELAIGRL